MLPSSWKSVVRFVPREFDDPDFPGSGTHIDALLVLNLDKLAITTNWRVITHWRIGGCVDMKGSHGHARSSYHRSDRGCKAADVHFLDINYEPLNISLREQYVEVCKAGFPGIGIYPWWKPYPGGFHVDARPRILANHWYSPTRKVYRPLFP